MKKITCMKKIIELKKGKIALLAFLCALAIIPFEMNAQTNSQKNQTITADISNVDNQLILRCKEFFESLISGKTDDAFKKILLNSPISAKTEQLGNLVDQTKKAEELYGKMEGYDFVTCEKASNLLMKLKYLSAHAEYPMRWVFTFYKSPKHGWIIINILFDDVSDLFFND